MESDGCNAKQKDDNDDINQVNHHFLLVSLFFILIVLEEYRVFVVQKQTTIRTGQESSTDGFKDIFWSEGAMIGRVVNHDVGGGHGGVLVFNLMGNFH